MTQQEYDSTTFEGTITAGTSEVLEVDTGPADNVVVLMDDGTQDGAPATYDMVQRVYMDELDAYQFYDEVVGDTSRSWVDDAWGSQMRFEFTNTSGADATYRIVVKSYEVS